jgi:hypothetical protein
MDVVSAAVPDDSVGPMETLADTEVGRDKSPVTGLAVVAVAHPKGCMVRVTSHYRVTSLYRPHTVPSRHDRLLPVPTAAR